MPRKAFAICGATALLAAAVPLVLLARVGRADVATQVAPPPERPVRVVVASRGESGRIALVPRRFPHTPEARYALLVSVGSNRPLARFALDLRDERGRRLSLCEFGPGDYEVEAFRQVTLLTCPLPDARTLATVTFVADARRSDIAIWARRRADGGFSAGSLLAGQPEGVSPALDRLAVTRPRLFRGPTLLAALALSVAALGAAAVVFWGSSARAPHERARGTDVR